MDNLNITGFETIGLYGIDLAYLLKGESENHFNAKRGSNDWLDTLLEKSTAFINNNKCNFNSPRSAVSSYANPNNTDQSNRNIFSKPYEKFMPLVFELNGTIEDSDLFNIEILSISINRNGAITIKIKAFKKDSNKETNIEQVIGACYNYKKIINEKIRSCLNDFIKLLSDCYKDNKQINFITEISSNEFEQYMSYYEIIDFDYTTGAKKITIKDIYNDKKDYLKHLVALFRMTKSEFSKYDKHKISDISSNDYGNREDELWAVSQDRLLRHYPYDKTDKDKDSEYFFLDIILGIEILLQQKIVLQYLNQWIGKQNVKLREVIDSNKYVLSVFKVFRDKMDSLISEMAYICVNIYDIIYDSFMMQKRTNHAFFNLIIEKSSDKMYLNDILRFNREMISDLFSLLTSISSQRITKFMWILSIMMIIIGLLQLV